MRAQQNPERQVPPPHPKQWFASLCAFNQVLLLLLLLLLIIFLILIFILILLCLDSKNRLTPP